MAGSGILLGSLLLLGATLLLLRPRRRQHYPPGPPPKPLIGNALDMPKVRPWEKYREWCRTYNSDIIYLSLPTHPVIIVNTVKVAMELLDKRSNIYSGRIRFYMVEMMSWDLHFGGMTYGARWRAHRQLFHKHFPPTDTDKYTDVQLREIRRFLSHALKSPQHTRKFIRQAITAIIVKILYGKQIDSMDDEYVVTAEKATEGLSIAVLPGGHLVEFFPILRHFPSWLPGGGSKRVAEKYIPYVRNLRNKAFLEVKSAFGKGTPRPCVVSSMIEDIHAAHGGTAEEAVQEDMAMNVAGSTYTAGADTTTSAAESFVLAMALYPDVQRKAQAELDRVIGSGRLPIWDDLDNLPYIRATVMETWRWMPVTPFGVPHCVTADDMYEGYHIPKGASVVPNVWAMLHNPEDYPDPENFVPDRFIGKDGKIDSSVRDPTPLLFGFGRRVCPGKHIAIKNLQMFIASVLLVFDISAGVDEDGKPNKLSAELLGAMVANPVTVPTGLKPRSAAAAQLVHESDLALSA
ncbi:hypothetical protein EIP91_008276 [Steccherinum ochraceum]|uniref:Cytochrome P450 n=1 Tax=Steccherinum ochraceum TaxID=92696 RepID=A0A4R0R325_9APHY|nr:hypothetical protein EIP91_008276 [Steccherinum ochraceum]